MKRRRLTPAERAALLTQQGGLCVTWGCTESRALIEEHSTPFTWTGAKADQLMCAACHKAKTRDDIKKIAKVRRIKNGKTQADKRAVNGPKLRSNLKLQGRGFDRTLTKSISTGKVTRRER